MTFTMKTPTNHTLIFSRPFLNDDKELVFLDCNEFSRYPNTLYVLNETDKAIEIRNPKIKKKVFLLLKGNEDLLSEATKEKTEILNLIREYSKNLKNGSEEIWISCTNDQEVPYFFTTQTIALHGEKSSKFIAGFLYFLNLMLKEKKSKTTLSSYDGLHKELSKMIQAVGFHQLEKLADKDHDVYRISLQNLNKFLR